MPGQCQTHLDLVRRDLSDLNEVWPRGSWTNLFLLEVFGPPPSWLAFQLGASFEHFLKIFPSQVIRSRPLNNEIKIFGPCSWFEERYHCSLLMNHFEVFQGQLSSLPDFYEAQEKPHNHRLVKHNASCYQLKSKENFALRFIFSPIFGNNKVLLCCAANDIKWRKLERRIGLQYMSNSSSFKKAILGLKSFTKNRTQTSNKLFFMYFDKTSDYLRFKMML